MQDYKFNFWEMITFESIAGFNPCYPPVFKEYEKFKAMEREAYAMGILRAKEYRSVICKDTGFVLIGTKFFPIGLN